MKKKSFLFFLLTVALLTGGCAGHINTESYVHNPPPVWKTSMTIAEDAAEKLLSLYPPGFTQIELIHPANADADADNDGLQRVGDDFSFALENGLRLRGFTITPLASLRLSWHLDVFPDIEGKTDAEDLNWYLRLNLTDKEKSEVRRLTRMYNANGLPMAGFADEQSAGR